jgi:hypothetical protein
MKKISIAIAILMLLALVVPAAVSAAAPPITSNSGTNVTVGGGGTTQANAPFIKAKWEMEYDNNINLIGGGTQSVVNNLESGDPTHLIPGTQINPPMIHQATKTIWFFAVVADPQGIQDVQQGEVFSYVFHPTPSPAPYSNYIAPDGTTTHYKYKVLYTNDLGSGASAAAYVTQAFNAGLITFGDKGQEGGTGLFALADLTNASGTGELDKHTAELWMGTEVIDFEQPAGNYTVNVYANDKAGNLSLPLTNTFLYEPITGVEVDFSTINYDGVSLKLNKTIPGDLTWNTLGTNNATVRNIGNTWAQITVAQNDMGFGKAGSSAGTSYQGTVAPIYTQNPTNTATQSNWNVYFDAVMGNNLANEMFFDPTAKGSAMTNVVTLPGTLGLSALDELDFSICVQDGSGTHTGSMVIGSVWAPFSDGGTATSYTPSHPAGQP